MKPSQILAVKPSLGFPILGTIPLLSRIIFSTALAAKREEQELAEEKANSSYKRSDWTRHKRKDERERRGFLPYERGEKELNDKESLVKFVRWANFFVLIMMPFFWFEVFSHPKVRTLLIISVIFSVCAIWLEKSTNDKVQNTEMRGVASVAVYLCYLIPIPLTLIVVNDLAGATFVGSLGDIGVYVEYVGLLILAFFGLALPIALSLGLCIERVAQLIGSGRPKRKSLRPSLLSF
ncbi:hypothetical protein [Vibrio neonatus]|uniref:hypothetical protein n=1 Tax=Vibrio neonatus TaxID=278860 RepID=UPI0021C383AA|nr:hypothetical protein [Vibrio neonatus]